MIDLLLPSGYQLDSGHTVLNQVQSGDGWQIFSTNSSGSLLLISKELADINFDSRVLSAKLFTCCTIYEEIFYLLETEPSYELNHVKYSEIPKVFSEAKAIENSVLIISMTNQVEMLDPAITRRGRFDFCIEVEMPSEEEFEEVFEYLVSDLPYNLNNKGELYSQLYGRQPSDVAFVVKETGRIATRLRDESLKTEYFMKAIDKLPKVDTRNKIGFI